MAKVRVAPLVAPSIYPDNPTEILLGLQNAVYVASEGQLNDFSPHAPLTALSEGFLFAILELLYYANKVPDAAGLSFLKVAGIQRILGRPATVTLTFTIAPIGNNFTLSPGYIVRDTRGNEFTTDERLDIPAGQTTGTVSATSSVITGGVRIPGTGTRYNSPAYTITQLSETRAYLIGVTNKEAATGGTNAESLEETKIRGFRALRRRDTLISADDYEQATRSYLGEGSVAVAIGRLASDRITYQNGTVHVFCLGADGQAPSIAQMNDLRGYLGQRSPAGLHLVSVSPIELENLELNVIASLIPGSDPENVAFRINAALADYLQPGNLPIGKSVLIKELENVVRNSGVETVQSVSVLISNDEDNSIEVSYSDIPLPHLYSAAILYDLTVTLVNTSTKVEYKYSFGDGGDKD